MWLDPEADGCVYDTVDCYHNCQGCYYAYPHFGGEFAAPEEDEEITRLHELAGNNEDE